MTSNLTDFLEAEDLDELLEIKSFLLALSKTDAEKIRGIINDWQWSQAIANLLIYPELIPEDCRLSALLKGLQEQEINYYPLAAIVGLEKINPNTFYETLKSEELRSEEVRADVFENLLTCLEYEALLIVQRGTVALSQYKLPYELDRMSRWLNYPDDMVKHNILATLINGEGLAATQVRLADLLKSGSLSDFNIPFLQERLRTIEICLEDTDKTSANTLIDNLKTIKLAYIPNLVEWKSNISFRKTVHL